MSDRVVLGKTAGGEDVVLTYEQRRQDTYVIGVNGTGKTTLLREIAYSDMRQDPKHGLCVIDPHGDLIDDIIAMVPEERVDDVILFDPSDEDFPFCLSLFAPAPRPEEIGRVASEIVAIFRKIFGAGWTPEIEGVVQNVTLTLLARPAEFRLNGEPWIAAMDEIPALLAMERVEEGDEKQPPWRRRVQTYRSQFYQLLQQQDQIPVWEFWNYSFDPLTPRPRSELTFAVLNQVRRFLANPAVRNIVAQTQSKLDLSKVISEGKILLVNLSKGKLGEANSAFLGSVIVAKLVVAVFGRAKVPRQQRKPFHIICDEFQNFAISSFPMLLSEARKYNVDLVIAHQYRDQLRDWVQGATVNAGNIVCFRVGGDDALEMAREFDATPPTVDAEYRGRYRLYHELHVPLYKGELEVLHGGREALDALKRLLSGQPPDAAGLTEARKWLMASSQLVPDKPVADKLKALSEAEPLKVTERIVKDLEAAYQRLFEVRRAVTAYVQERARYPDVPGRYSSRVDAEGYYAGSTESSESGPIFDKVPGRPRPYSDVYQQTANSLTHLPNFHALCRLSGSDAAPIEETFRTDEWPEEYQDPTERLAGYERNLETTKKNTQRDFTRPKKDVVEEFQKRYEIMLGSIGMTWSRGQPLPTPEILYEDED